MKKTSPKSISFYVKELREFIPKEAYKTAEYKLIPMFLHVLHFIINLGLIKNYNTLWVTIICSMLMGFSIICIFVYSHEFSHGGIIRKKNIRYVLENFFWAFVGIPPTVWKRVHNSTHHQTMNTYNDPDRKTFKSEAGFLNNLYNLFIYPNKRIRYSLTVGFAMIFYSLKHTLAVFYKEGSKPSIVTYRPNYTRKEQRAVVLEFLYILLFWFSIVVLLGWPTGIIVCLISWVTYSTFVISIIITQHQRNPAFIDIPDPLLTSTSIIIPKWLDRIVDWHSFHVEHHIFPGINFDYYPQLSEKIAEKYPDKYDRIPMLQALKECYDEEVLIDDPLT